MNDSPYIFPELTATRGGIPDPLVEVDSWLSRLQDVLDTGPETADEAYDLLALWAKLRRVRPELIEQLGGRQAWEQATALLTAGGTGWASRALTIPNPPQWLKEARTLKHAFEHLGTAEQRSTLAESLLTDLDDATLVLYAARWLDGEDRELESELAPCLDWLAEHAALFLPAAVHIQAVGMALRPDLADFDYGLAVTALKYLDMLCAIEAAEEELALTEVPQLAPADARRLAAECQRQRQWFAAAAAAYLSRAAILRDRMRHRPLARAGEAGPQASLLWWVWSSPAGDLTARLTISPEPAGDERVMLEFLDTAHQRATGLAGEPVMLHGVPSRIDPSGKATFSLSPLLETDQPLVLRVGTEQIEWHLTETNTER